MHAMALKYPHENQNQELQVTHGSKTPTLRINDLYSIEVEISPKEHVGEDELDISWKRVLQDMSRKSSRCKPGDRIKQGHDGSVQRVSGA